MSAPEPVTATSGEALQRWRCERLRAYEQTYDTLPPGLYAQVLADTPEAAAERMRRNAA